MRLYGKIKDILSMATHLGLSWLHRNKMKAPERNMCTRFFDQKTSKSIKTSPSTYVPMSSLAAARFLLSSTSRSHHLQISEPFWRPSESIIFCHLPVSALIFCQGGSRSLKWKQSEGPTEIIYSTNLTLQGIFCLVWASLLFLSPSLSSGHLGLNYFFPFLA